MPQVCSNWSPLALRATAVNAAYLAAKQPRDEVRVSTWLSEASGHRTPLKRRYSDSTMTNSRSVHLQINSLNPLAFLILTVSHTSQSSTIAG